MSALANHSDESLLAMTQNLESSGNPEFDELKDGVMSELIKRYVNVIVIKANKMARGVSALNRQDAEDFISEGFLALLTAIRTYDETKGSFCAYANVCIDNRVKNALGKARRMAVLSEDFDPDLIKAQGPGADEVLIEKESREELRKKIKKVLSRLEFEVFLMYLNSYSYVQIAKSMGLSVKSVDNALSRARIKLKSQGI